MDRKLKHIFYLFIPLLIIQTCLSQMPEKSGICSVCSCTDEVVDYTVNCEGTVKNYFKDVLKPEHYVDDTNEPYQIKKLAFTDHIINFFNGTFPPSDLKILDMSDNAIKRISDGAFSNLQKMEELVLSNNYLGREVIHYNLFKGIRTDGQDYPLISLQTLRLDNNEIQWLDSSTFQHIDRDLKNLYLNDNPLKVLNESTIQAITSIVFLEILDLSNCKLNVLSDSFLHTNKYLAKLNLSGNAITDVSSLHLGMSKSLKILDLSRNMMENITEENGFPRIENLKVLHMCYMENLVEVSKYSLGKLEALEELHLSENHQLQKIHTNALIRKVGETHVPVVQRIKKIYLRNNQLSHLDLQLNWDLIVDFDIRGNPWTCECENEIFLDIIVPKYIDLNHSDYAKDLKCASPEPMVGRNMYNLHALRYEMRCLDMYGNHPEKDGTILVCLLVGLLLGITLVLGCMYSYQNRWFGIFDTSPSGLYKRYYGRTKTGEDDEIY